MFLLLPSLPVWPPWVVEHWTRVDTAELTGYQVWAIEQRATDRNAVLPVVAVHTGNPEDVIKVERFILAGRLEDEARATKLSPEQELVWAQTKALLKGFGARVSETQIGFLPITALPTLSGDYSLVQIPEGNYIKYWRKLYTNINLKRLGLGGRSGLRLADVSSAQQSLFRQLFSLPIPSPSPVSAVHSPSQRHFTHPHTRPHAHSHSPSYSLTNSPNTNVGIGIFLPPPPSSAIQEEFEFVVLDLIVLVQNALALFAMGPVQVPLLMEEDGTAVPKDEGHKLGEGDGLLCDATLIALHEFRLDVASPFLDVSLDETGLTPALLAALLSLVLSTQEKLAALGTGSVPKDPFNRRTKFLGAVSTFLRNHPSTTIHSPRLSLPLLSHLHECHTRLVSSKRKHVDLSLSRTSSRVSRALIGKLGITSLTSPVENSSTGGGEDEKDGEANLETPDLDNFVANCVETHSGSVADSVKKLWDPVGFGKTIGGKRARKIRRRLVEAGEEAASGSGDARRTSDREGTAVTVASTSEGEMTGSGLGATPRAILRGVRDSAGKATRLLGDGLGLTESASLSNGRSNSLPASSTPLVAPSVVISLDPAETPSPERPGYTRKPSVGIGGTLKLNTNSLSNRLTSVVSSPSLSTPTSSSSRPTVTASAPNVTDSNRLPVPSLLSPLMLSTSRLRQATAAGLPVHAVRTDSIHLAPAEAPLSRTVSEAYSSAGYESNAPSGGDESNLESGQSDITSVKRVRRKRRRHSFHAISEAPDPFVYLSRKRLEMDVNLRMAAWTLRQRETQLVEMVEALKIVQTSYDQALLSLEAPLLSRTQLLDSLTLKAHALSFHADSFTTSESPLAPLATGSARLLYSQERLEEKLLDVTTFETNLADKVRIGGSLDLGMEKLEKEQGGMRRFVTSLEGWSSLLVDVGSGFKSFCGNRGLIPASSVAVFPLLTVEGESGQPQESLLEGRAPDAAI